MLCGNAMGFTWAFYIAQEVHRGFAERFIPGSLPYHFIAERNPALLLGAPEDKAVLIYADNSHRISPLAEDANAMREGLSRALNGHGLLTHEIVETTQMSEALGASIDLKEGVACSTAARVESPVGHGLRSKRLLWGFAMSES